MLLLTFQFNHESASHTKTLLLLHPNWGEVAAQQRIFSLLLEMLTKQDVACISRFLCLCVCGCTCGFSRRLHNDEGWDPSPFKTSDHTSRQIFPECCHSRRINIEKNSRKIHDTVLGVTVLLFSKWQTALLRPKFTYLISKWRSDVT